MKKISVMLLFILLSLSATVFAAGDLVVPGNATVGNNLTVTGTAATGSSTVNGNATINGNATVSGSATVSGTLNVPAGNAIISTATISNATMGAATITGNATVNGNLGVGTSTPTQKLDVNGNVKGTALCIGTDCKSSWKISGQFYGLCKSRLSACPTIVSPAACSGGVCGCATGYTPVPLGQIVPDGDTVTNNYWTCFKN